MSEIKWNVGERIGNPRSHVEIEDGSGYVVAIVYTHEGSARNARRETYPALIAAAPELYEALDSMVKLIQHTDVKNAVPVGLALAALSKATLLAKARGEAQ